MKYTLSAFDIIVSKNSVKPMNFPKFIGNEIRKGIYKLYVVKDKDKFLYIGITKDYISSRLNFGVKSTQVPTSNGYHGYKWFKSYEGKMLNLIIVAFPLLTEKTHLELIETIEAEVVFQIRTKYGEWCHYQNEIHFHNKGQEIIELAKNIFYELCEK